MCVIIPRSDLPRLVGECVEKLRKDVNAGGLSNVEIEARLGHFNRITKGFVSGVSRRYFEGMKATLVKAYNSRAQSNEIVDISTSKYWTCFTTTR